MIRLEITEDFLTKRICVHAEDYATKVHLDKEGQAHTSHHLAASIYSQMQSTDENLARLVLLARKVQNQLDAIVPGLFNQLPPDDTNAADAMRILALADELEARL